MPLYSTRQASLPLLLQRRLAAVLQQCFSPSAVLPSTLERIDLLVCVTVLLPLQILFHTMVNESDTFSYRMSTHHTEHKIKFVYLYIIVFVRYVAGFPCFLFLSWRSRAS